MRACLEQSLLIRVFQWWETPPTYLEQSRFTPYRSAPKRPTHSLSCCGLRLKGHYRYAEAKDELRRLLTHGTRTLSFLSRLC